ncbi:MAG: hypothetical protein ACI4L6_03005 [Candidatus Onthoplasma sp.]
MKIILIFVLLTVVMIVAFKVSSFIKDKYNFYVHLKEFLNEFKLNLSFKREKITDFLTKRQYSKSFDVFINSYKEYLKSGELNLSDLIYLDDDEKEQLKAITTSIGRLDTQSELAQIEEFIAQINMKLQTSEKEKNKLCPLILKLSFLSAISVIIILI